MKVVRTRHNELQLAKWQKLTRAGAVARPDSGIDQGLSYLWLAKGMVSKVNFRNGIAVQEMCLLTNTLTEKGRNATGGLCRRCHKAPETVQHVAAGCDTFRLSIMLDRHNDVCRAIYDALCRLHNMPFVHHTQKVPPIYENDRVKVLWDQHIVTRHKLKHNRPDMVIFDKIARRIVIVEVSVSWFSFLAPQRKMKIAKYARNSMIENVLELQSNESVDDNLVKELGELWGSQFPGGVTVVPIIVGCCGEVQSFILSDLEQLGLQGKEGLRVLERVQRSAVLGTSRLIRAHLSI
jgi:hypothetical protein